MARPQAPRIDVSRWRPEGWVTDEDAVAAEEPLQLRLDGEELAIVMRTPGDDVELALGLLFAERVILSAGDVAALHLSAESGEVEAGRAVSVVGDLLESNAVDVHLVEGAGGRRPRRTFTSNAACGICGLTTVEDLAADLAPVPFGEAVDPALLPALAGRLRDSQGVFAETGGLHAAGLFSRSGELVIAREDVGRHNAVDKVVGWALLHGRLPASDLVLAVSGRIGFEVAQKAVAAGIPLVVAVGAPSSLAVQLARRFDLTLAGFLRDDRFNVYSAEKRLRTR